MATAQLAAGQAGTLDLEALVEYPLVDAAPVPDGMTFSEPGLLTGTPTTAGDTAVVCFANDGFGSPVEVGTVTVTVVELPELVVGVPVTALPVWELVGSPEDVEGNPGVIDGATLPPGLTRDEPDRRTISGTPTTAGPYTVEVYGIVDAHGSEGTLRTLELVILAEPSEPDPEDPEDPEPGDPDPEDPEDPEDPVELDPWDVWEGLGRSLAPRVAAFVGHAGNAELTATAEAQVPVVAEYVRGFTRGRGFRGESPAGPLRAVIVSGVARLATNPEQVSVFTTGDYSERPAQLAGWTLAELGVLRRYRRVTA